MWSVKIKSHNMCFNWCNASSRSVFPGRAKIGRAFCSVPPCFWKQNWWNASLEQWRNSKTPPNQHWTCWFWPSQCVWLLSFWTSDALQLQDSKTTRVRERSLQWWRPMCKKKCCCESVPNITWATTSLKKQIWHIRALTFRKLLEEKVLTQ